MGYFCSRDVINSKNDAMKRIIAFLAVLVMCFSPLLLQGQTRRALVIGLGEQMDPAWGKINGDKDVPYVTSMLQMCGYKDITTLVNQQATKSGILSAFKALTSKCRRGDIVYIHFSGHGQMVTDVSGDEADGWDESWIPYDAYRKPCKRDRVEKHLIDDEVNTLLTGIANKVGVQGKILVVVDACHSGDSSREMDIDETVRGVFDKFEISEKKKPKGKPLKEKWLTLSACKSSQLNQELKKPKVGKLTYVLNTLVRQGTVSMQDVYRQMSQKRSAIPQSPELTGEVNYTVSDVLR